MSKLANAVYNIDRKRIAKPASLDALRVTATWKPHTDTDCYEYRIGVGLEHRIVISAEEAQRNDRALTDAIREVRRAIIEEVFGEFRPHLRAIQMACYRHDMEAAREAVNALEKQMFSAEEEK